MKDQLDIEDCPYTELEIQKAIEWVIDSFGYTNFTDKREILDQQMDLSGAITVLMEDFLDNGDYTYRFELDRTKRLLHDSKTWREVMHVYYYSRDRNDDETWRISIEESNDSNLHIYPAINLNPFIEESIQNIKDSWVGME